MFQVKNANRGSVNLGSLFSDKQITSAFKTVDPYASNFYEQLVKQLTENGEVRLNKALNAFSPLSAPEALRLAYAYYKSEPEKQALLLLTAKRGTLACVAEEIEAQYPPSSSAAKYLLTGVAPKLPNCCASLPQPTRLRYLLAKWATSRNPDVLGLIQTLRTTTKLTCQCLKPQLSELVQYLKSHHVQINQVEPEAVFLVKSELFQAFLEEGVAEHLFSGEAPRAKLEALKAAGLRNALVSLNAAWQSLNFQKINQLFEKIPNSLIDQPLKAPLQRALKERMMSTVQPKLVQQFKNLQGQPFVFMDKPAGRALSHLLGLQVPDWATGDEKAFVQLLTDYDLVPCLNKQQLRALIDKIGMPMLTACAAHASTQKLVKNHLEAYEPLPLVTIWRAVKTEKMFQAVGWPKLTVGSLSTALFEGVPREKIVWLKTYLATVDEQQSEAIKTFLVKTSPKTAIQVVDSSDACWQEVSIGALLKQGFWSVLLHMDASRLIERIPQRYLVDWILVGCGKKKGFRKPYDRLDDRALQDAYQALTSKALLRRHFLMTLLERDWCNDRCEGSYQIMGGRFCSYKVLAIELLRCRPFLGDQAFRQEVITQALQQSNDLNQCQILLRLIQQDSVESHLPEAWIKAVLSWPKEVLNALLPKMSHELLDAYVARAGIEVFEACYEVAPKALSSQQFFALRIHRLKTGGTWPKDRVMLSDAQGFDEVIETASNLLGASEPRLWDASLERMAEKTQAVLLYAKENARAVMSPALMRWVDVILNRYALKPDARLDALLADHRTTDVKFWPHQGPDGTKGDVYAYLRVHHSLKALGAVWSDRETLPDSVLPTMVAHWPNDAAWFELLLALGKSHTSLLRQVMGMMDFKAPFGSRFDAHYRHSTIPKKNGGVRDIYAPERALKALQSLINVKLLQPLGAHDAAFGFVPGRNISGNAERHVGQPVVATADIHACFPSVSRGLVVHALKRDLGDRFSYGAILKLADICLSKGVLPTGAPTSPTLLNRVLLRTDELLTDAASKKGCTYTRYADDITFSGDDGAVSLLGVAKGVLKPIGLTLDPKKTNVFRRGRRQCCTGLVVNDRVSVNRETCRRLRASVHALELGRPLLWDGQPETVAQLRGRLAFLASVKKEEGARLMARLDAALMQKTVSR